jgi:archaellum component FlaC
MEKKLMSDSQNNDHLQSAVEAVGAQVAGAEAGIANEINKIDARVAQLENTLGQMNEKIDSVAKMVAEAIGKLDAISRGVPALAV